KKNKAFTTKLTGGSSGTPMSIAYDLKHYASRRATTRFFKNLAGYDDYTIRLGIPSLGPLYKTNQEFYEYNPITNQIFISSTHLSKEIFQKYINIIRKYNPQYAEGHPSVFYKFALYLKEKNITNIQLKSLQSCGEVLYPFQRDAISKTFNCEIFDFYANEEGICYASECKSHNGMHISPIMGFVEIENQKENQPGEIIATGLCNYYMPLIRYNLQDMGIITTEKCECGNSFSRLTSVIGRSNDTIILPDKTQIPPNHFTSAMEKFRFAEGFQIIQEDQKNININIVKKGKINLKETKILKKYMESLTKNQMTISINQVKDINPIGRKNKYKYIISKI
ncbi:MAG: hypothetical protein L6408_06785, partial [Nanoarchaeota archaeon]|nr:hypothetical protein [Nanoarchaeota archaeon]